MGGDHTDRSRYRRTRSVPGGCGSDEVGPPDGAIVDGGDSGFDAPANCDLKKDPKDSPDCVVSSVGIFVSEGGLDTNDGSKEKPVKTIGKALSIAGG